MFTGIVQGQGQIKSIVTGTNQRSFVITLPQAISEKVDIGASIAINGTCLTVTAQRDNHFSFDVIGQTLKLTNLGLLKQGDWVNVERSLKYGDEIGGHIISGHVSIALAISQIDKQDGNTNIWFNLPEAHKKHVLPQGFIGLNGCSLTVGCVEESKFCVCLIPETLRVTGFGNANPGDLVNMEIDHQTQTIVATVERVLATRN
ncbi:MAG: riboflavin synthase subunit alpha [Oceanospirillaceae bacterium]|nr:riboflavin synthase subunit alpha [Oceanospirillaceae bacterium]